MVHGRVAPVILDNWDQTKPLVNCFPDPVFKKFKTIEEGVDFIEKYNKDECISYSIEEANRQTLLNFWKKGGTENTEGMEEDGCLVHRKKNTKPPLALEDGETNRKADEEKKDEKDEELNASTPKTEAELDDALVSLDVMFGAAVMSRKKRECKKISPINQVG